MKKMLAVGAIVMIGIVMVGIAGISANNEQATGYEAEVRVNDAHSTYFKVLDIEVTIGYIKKFKQIFQEIEAGKHLPKGDTPAIPDAKSAADAMIRYYYKDKSFEDDILDYIPLKVGYYKGVWYVQGLYLPYENRVEPYSLLIEDGSRPRILLRAEDGMVLGARTRLMDPII
ncbi:hypothetical protein [Entomospira culicis]|uniref:Uncharacterized protein n=1 Tax=Entomospira culicis TaxID=2719989 RepID=A0A968GJ44_9SPIO|nr:hypothetical protein [Entomospira culicis]NIZ19778.1 hypothetical protein [Entomospira culicis]NIZ69992.1 hypothetical protein [Entomospira culicis]WDI37097.1 hypothetical protein PVA46_07190 [Entomospira culicis]WDI38726.1 hypothetical protein PVA47_07200 [Entomospira culicis]